MTIRHIDNDDRTIIARTDAMIEDVIRKWHTSTGKTAAVRAAGVLFVRVAASWHAICKLLDGCQDRHRLELFSTDVAAILRCLHDASLQAEYILKGDKSRRLAPDELGDLYLSFETVERFRMMKKGLTFSSQLARHLATSPLRPEGEAKLQQDFDRIKGAYTQGSGSKVRPHWYKGNLAQIAKKLGREEEHFWFLRSFDSCIHAGPWAVLHGPVPAGADLMVLANDLVCHTANRLVSAAAIAPSPASAEVLGAGSDSILDHAASPLSVAKSCEPIGMPRLALAALNLPGVGPKTGLAILTAIKSVPEALVSADLIALIRECGERRTDRLTERDAARALELADRMLDIAANEGITVLSALDAEFPTPLRSIPNPPLVLYVRGNRAALKRSDAVAIIGTRQPTSFGAKAAHRFGMRCAEAGLVVVSGLARGCDTSAHQGCLDGNGVTVAVLAHGLDRVYPAKNNVLADRILEANGALISEYAVGEAPRRNYFVERNRLQSGLSRAVIVIETDVKGGTMHTVRFAQEQGREIACLVHPSELRNEPTTHGNDKLIREGVATPIGSAAELAALIGRVQALDASQGSVAAQMADSDKFQLELWGHSDIGSHL